VLQVGADYPGLCFVIGDGFVQRAQLYRTLELLAEPFGHADGVHVLRAAAVRTPPDREEVYRVSAEDRGHRDDAVVTGLALHLSPGILAGAGCEVLAPGVVADELICLLDDGCPQGYGVFALGVVDQEVCLRALLYDLHDLRYPALHALPGEVPFVDAYGGDAFLYHQAVSDALDLDLRCLADFQDDDAAVLDQAAHQLKLEVAAYGLVRVAAHAPGHGDNVLAAAVSLQHAVVFPDDVAGHGAVGAGIPELRIGHIALGAEGAGEPLAHLLVDGGGLGHGALRLGQGVLEEEVVGALLLLGHQGQEA